MSYLQRSRATACRTGTRPSRKAPLAAELGMASAAVAPDPGWWAGVRSAPFLREGLAHNPDQLSPDTRPDAARRRVSPVRSSTHRGARVGLGHPLGQLNLEARADDVGRFGALAEV